MWCKGGICIDILDQIVFSKEASNLDSYKIIDADWKDNLGVAVVLKVKRQLMILLNENDFLTIPFKLQYSIVRWIDKNTLLIADSRNENDLDNVFILNLAGKILVSFNGGDGIEDIEIGKEGIWISYFDEGVFGNGISTEGLVLFDFTGKAVFRYHSDLTIRPSISDCYAICKGKASSVWLFPYSNFCLIQIYPETKAINYYKVPQKLYGSQALCVRGNYAYFFDRYNSDDELFSWEIGEKKPQLIGKIDGVLRGLSNSENNHFISISEEFVKLYKIINADEYNN
ncbi:TetR family transcriptional regulator [Bacillus testis]|uniref:TetR family transcriptional regulator n=1 Tax=Bacillus testis TaxID=1622072 RepID=UPI000A40C811|nr:TetR family transcriptional regulator [Bacillus testis]